MPGNNPVFQRVEKDMRSGYAGFGADPRAATPMPPYQSAPSSAELQDMYDAPPATPTQAGRVTFDDVIMKTLGLFAVVVGVAAAAWVYVINVNPSGAVPLLWGGMLGTLVVGLAIAFMKKVSVPLIAVYAVLEGAFVGAISAVMESAYPGLVATAVLATVCTFAGMFIGYRTKLIKVTSRSRRIFGFALLGYVLFGLVNLFTQVVGWTQGWGIGNGGGLGILISVLGVGLASYSLAVDFDTIEHTVAVGAPQRYSWLLAHGLIVSLVWLYIEILRLLARLRD